MNGALTIPHLWSLPAESHSGLRLTCIYVPRQHKQSKMYSEIAMKVLKCALGGIWSYTFKSRIHKKPWLFAWVAAFKAVNYPRAHPDCTREGRCPRCHMVTFFITSQKCSGHFHCGPSNSNVFCYFWSSNKISWQQVCSCILFNHSFIDLQLAASTPKTPIPPRFLWVLLTTEVVRRQPPLCPWSHEKDGVGGKSSSSW